jgi:hypothetical protein
MDSKMITPTVLPKRGAASKQYQIIKRRRVASTNKAIKSVPITNTEFITF